ncbi:hypothetical protein [Thermodesulforhabdus norvegica]|uniref:Uncharacterized protein n=1 Tax=Thermodesulforhabdus norvegica TaxID=39841 RepID=A0A1I4U7G1_9BACT|nr:hypothetical protein [Thermodesulforhabdus norvegica]SFM84835.1 hypothetical protein SAMN05660836_01680 [Thermodesulforhabdus norvegica]
MTQMAVVCTDELCALGIDSAAVYYNTDGSVEKIVNLDKIIRLSPEVILAVAGSGYGIPLAVQLNNHLQKRGIWNYGDVVRRAIFFLREAIPRLQFSLKNSSTHPDLERFYFLFMGRNQTKLLSKPLPEAHLVMSEELNGRLQIMPVPRVLTIPRQMGLELRLIHLVNARANSRAIVQTMHAYFRELSQSLDDVKPPFHFAIVSCNDFSLLRLSD